MPPSAGPYSVPMPGEPASAAAFIEARRVLDEFLCTRGNLDIIEQLAELLHRQLAGGHKVLACGNGGSACEAMHFAEELTGRFRGDRAPLAAMACGDPGHITCTANDFGYEHIFARWVQALGRPGDVLILLSTSGNSPNLLHAAHAARHRHMISVALLGRGGGRLRGVCDHELIVPGHTPDRIQELHLLILHALVEGVERLMGAAPPAEAPSRIL